MVTSSSSKLSVIGRLSGEITKTNDDWILKCNLSSLTIKSEPVSEGYSACRGSLASESVEPLILKKKMLKND
jgi:hypothetical protein